MLDHNGMTPLHVLVNNPHATTGSILECFKSNMLVAFVMDAIAFAGDDDDSDDDNGSDSDINNKSDRDSYGKNAMTGRTVIDYLWKRENIDCLVSLVQALCLHHDANSNKETKNIIEKV